MGRARATWKHLGAPGAGVVSGVNGAGAAGSDGWLGSPNKSATLPGKMEKEAGRGCKGDHSSLIAGPPPPSLKGSGKHQRPSVQSTRLNREDIHPSTPSHGPQSGLAVNGGGAVREDGGGAGEERSGEAGRWKEQKKKRGE